MRHVEVEHVQCVVDGLDLLHLDDPAPDLLLGAHQHPATVVLRLAQNLNTEITTKPATVGRKEGRKCFI